MLIVFLCWCLLVISSIIVVDPIPDQVVNVGDDLNLQIDVSAFENKDNSEAISLSIETILPSWINEYFPPRDELEELGIVSTTCSIYAGVAMVDSFIILPTDAGFMIIDMANLYEPVIFYHSPKENGKSIPYVVGDTLYTTQYLGENVLFVFDISDKHSPNKLGGFAQTHSYGNDLFIKDENAFVVGKDGLLILNISNPNDIKLTATIPVIPGSNPDPFLEVEGFGDFLYVTINEFGLRIFDITNPAATTTSIGEWSRSTFARSHMALGGEDQVVFLTYYDGSDMVLNIIDVSDPEHPTPFGNSLFLSSGNDDETLFYGGGDILHTSRNVISISDLTNPTIISNHLNGNDVIIDAREILYTYTNDAILYAFNASSPENSLNLIDRYGICGNPQSVSYKDDYAFMAADEAGLQIFDARDRYSPTLSRLIDVNPITESILHEAKDVFVRDDDVAFVALSHYGFTIVNVSEKYDPLARGGSYRLGDGSSVISTFKTPENCNRVFCRGDFLFLVDGNLRIYNVTDLHHPTYLSFYNGLSNVDFYPIYVSRDGKFAFITSYNAPYEFHIVNVQNKSYPVMEGSMALDCRSECFCLDEREEFAYICQGENGVKIVDIRTKSIPYVVATMTCDFITSCTNYKFVHWVYVSGSRAFLNTGSNGDIFCSVFDVSDPFDPRLIIETEVDIDPPSEYVVAGNYMYESKDGGGFQISGFNDRITLTGVVESSEGCVIPITVKGEVFDGQTSLGDTEFSFSVKVKGGNCRNGTSIRCNGVLWNDSSVCSSNGDCWGNNSCVCMNEYLDDTTFCSTCKVTNNDILTKCVNCVDGYFGRNCDILYCYGKYTNESGVCSDNGICKLTGCDCEENYFGSNCDIISCFGEYTNQSSSSVCSGHGNCTSTDNCQCEKGWLNEDCSFLPKCGDFYANNPSVCSGHGNCSLQEICICSGVNYIGDLCEIRLFYCYGVSSTSLDVCHGRGKCIGDDTCNCTSHYYGNTCQDYNCYSVNSTKEDACSGHGECKSYNYCDCDDDYSGIVCNVTTCYSVISYSSEVCHTHGECVGYDFCKCLSGYFGKECEVTKCFGVFSNDTLENICYEHSSCTAYDTCLCDDGYYDSPECNTTKCFGVLSNDSNVCSKNGICLDRNHCVCNDTDEIKQILELNKECEFVKIGKSGFKIFGDVIHIQRIYTFYIIIASFVLFCCFCWVSLYCCCCCTLFFGFFSLIVNLIIGGGSGSVFFFLSGNKDGIDKVLKEELLAKQKHATVEVNKKLFTIKYKELKVLRSIGSGGSDSIVFHAEWRSGGIQDVAFKCFQFSMLFGTQKNFDMFEREAKIMASIRHPHCCAFYGCCLVPPRVGIVMEYCSNGDLKNFLEDNENFPIFQRFRILMETCDGMSYLHHKKVIHRDIKSENILLSEDLEAKIVDFGISRIIERDDTKKTKSIGTSVYMAPEVVSGEDYSEKCDIYSFGIVMWECILGDFDPYPNAPFNVEYKVASDENYRPDLECLRKRVSGEEISENILCEVLSRCWSPTPNDRPSFTEIREKLKVFQATLHYRNEKNDDQNHLGLKKEMLISSSSSPSKIILLEDNIFDERKQRNYNETSAEVFVEERKLNESEDCDQLL